MGEVYEFQPYPKWRYHAQHAAMVVQNAEDEAARTPTESGWADSVTDTQKPAPSPSPEPPATVTADDPPEPEPAPADPPPVQEQPPAPVRRPRKVK